MQQGLVYSEGNIAAWTNQAFLTRERSADASGERTGTASALLGWVCCRGGGQVTGERPCGPFRAALKQAARASVGLESRVPCCLSDRCRERTWLRQRRRDRTEQKAKRQDARFSYAFALHEIHLAEIAIRAGRPWWGGSKVGWATSRWLVCVLPHQCALAHVIVNLQVS